MANNAFQRTQSLRAYSTEGSVEAVEKPEAEFL